MTRQVVAAILVLVVVGIGLVGAAWATPTAAATANLAACLSERDPYVLTAQQRAACGYETFPLLGIERLPDGGLSYKYEIDDNPVWINVPPSGFKLAGASVETMDNYGIPTGRDQAWTDEHANMQFEAPPDFLVRIPWLRMSEFATHNWAGFAATGGGFTNAWNAYYEPVTQPGCSNSAVGMWAGLGGTTNGFLGQNGTQKGDPGMNADQAWYEILPAAPVVQSFYASPGYKFEVSTTYGPSSHTYTFFFYNAHTDTARTVSHVDTNYSGSSAEAIIERPLLNGTFMSLKQFGPVSMQGLANNAVIGSFSHDKYQMYSVDDVTLLSFTSGLTSNQYFSETWYACN